MSMLICTKRQEAARAIVLLGGARGHGALGSQTRGVDWEGGKANEDAGLDKPFVTRRLYRVRVAY